MSDSKSLLLNKMGVVTSVEGFFGKMFEIRDSLHLTHLYQKDFKLSTHMALEETYDAILPLIDSIVEGYTGLYYPPNIKINQARRIEDPVAFANLSYSIIKESRSLFTDTWIHNELDELAKVFAMLLYKLKYVT